MKKIPIIKVNMDDIKLNYTLFSKTNIPGWIFNDVASFSTHDFSYYTWQTNKIRIKRSQYAQTTGPQCHVNVFNNEGKWFVEAYDFNLNKLLYLERKTKEEAFEKAYEFMKKYKVEE